MLKKSTFMSAVMVALAAWSAQLPVHAAAPLAMAAAASATPNPALGTAVPVQPVRELTAADAEAWVDGLVPTALKTAQVPGAVVVVVKGDQVLLQKGYGYANYEKRIPVDARATLFRPGSTSKLFTWTAVMQLVEKGQLNLDADVNTYLDFQIPPREGKALTLRSIMTHTSGFEETAKDLLTYGDVGPSIGGVLKHYIPPRLFAPGSTPGYSNYATSLAGYIVERVSKQPFDDYIEQHLFAPLEMKHSTFRQPLPEAMRPHMSEGYMTWDKPGKGFEIISMPPAGSLSATGEDMAHFMIAHLQDGRYGSAQILKPETARTMHGTITRALPALNGIALGFYEQNINGRRVIAHGGDTVYFHSDLLLFTDDKVGLFISVNAPGKEGQGQHLRNVLFQAFADRYLPGQETTARVDAATATAHTKMIAGRYIGTRRADSSFLSVVGLISPMVVTANADNTISIELGGGPRKYAEASPFLWQEIDGHDRVQALVKDGKVTRWSSDGLAFAFTFEPAGGLAEAGLEVPMAVTALGLLALTALWWPVAVLVRRHYHAPFPLTGRRKAAYRALRVGAVLSLVAIGLWVQLFMLLEEVSPDMSRMLLLTQVITLVAWVGGLAVAVWNAVLTLRAGDSRWPSRLFAAALVLVFSALVWLGLRYHLISFNSNF